MTELIYQRTDPWMESTKRIALQLNMPKRSRKKQSQDPLWKHNSCSNGELKIFRDNSEYASMLIDLQIFLNSFKGKEKYQTVSKSNKVWKKQENW